MMTTSAFDILGPIMVGPSSSHTAGALRIAQVARSLAPQMPAHVRFVLYESFARTGSGHGTDRALVAGMLGLATDDERVRDAFALADEAGLAFDVERGQDASVTHPNTVDVQMEGDGWHTSVRGESLGGGRIRICRVNGVPVDLTGDYPTLFVEHRDKPGVLATLTALVSAAGTNIATMSTFRSQRGGAAYSVFELDGEVEPWLVESLRHAESVSFATSVHVPGAPIAAEAVALATPFSSGSELLAACAREGASIATLMRQRELELRPGEDVDALMEEVLAAMQREVCDTIDDPRRSLGGLLDGQAHAVATHADAFDGKLLGATLSTATAYAMAVLERSANMGVIVAAPTAGSAGVVPGTLLAIANAAGMDDERVRAGLWTAAAVGALFAENASVSGAEGGCQAEVGTAAAMAAAGLAELFGASPACCLDAAAITIANTLGLVCDPVRGLVEYPCQLRNAAGVANAVSAAQLALSGVESPLPFDEVVEAMRQVGQALPAALRETALAGLAAAPSACSACARCR